MQLKILRDDPTITHIAILGRLDVQGVNKLQYEFMHQTTSQPKSTLVDLSQVTFVASLGIGMLLGAAKYLERHGAKMVLLNPSALVRTALETANLERVIPIADEENAAMELLR